MVVHLLFVEVSVLGELLPQTNHLYLGKEVQMFVMPKPNDLPVPLRVSLLVAVVILEARLLMMRLMLVFPLPCILHVASYSSLSDHLFRLSPGIMDWQHLLLE